MREIDTHTQKVERYFDATAEEYDNPPGEEDPLYDRLSSHIFEKLTWHLVDPYLPRSGTVLDARGGTGNWAIPMAKRGLRAVIYDISDGILRVAKRKVKREGLETMISLRKGDLHDIPFPDGTFDLVFGEGIEYCTDLDVVYREMSRVLKPECYLITGVDGLYFAAWAMLKLGDSIDDVLELLRSNRYEDVEGVYCLAFTPERLGSMLSTKGLEVVKVAARPVLCQFLDKDLKKRIYSDPKTVEKLLEVEIELCESSGVAGVGSHLLVIARKR